MKYLFRISVLAAGLTMGSVFALAIFETIQISADRALLQSVGQETVSTSSKAIFVPIPSSQLVDDAFAAKPTWTVDQKARVFLMPHHTVAAREMAALVSAIKAPKRIIVIAPDHFSKGTSAFTTTYADFKLENGSRVTVDQDRASEMVRLINPLRDNRTALEGEHGVTALLPFFEAVWPKATVVPVLVRIDATEKQRQDLAGYLASALEADPETILIGSVDFSHYLPTEVADFHDVLAEDVIRTLDVSSADKAEVDSPGTFAITLEVARRLKFGQAEIHAHTNALKILQSKIAQESTSHFFVSFAPGEPKKAEATTLLFFGDMMFDRTVATRSNKAGRLDYPFEKIRGQENRFFWGQDAVIGNLEGSLSSTRRPPEKSIDFWFVPEIKDVLKSIGIDAVSTANNHALDQGREGMEEMKTLLSSVGIAHFGDQVKDGPNDSLTIIERRGKKIALLGFNTTDNPIDLKEAEASIKSAQEKLADYIVVYTHWGPEYQAKPAKAEVDLAHWFVDQGVDAVIGGHPHWVQSIETYKGKPIAYSLGNFIFDQDWSVETNLGLVVGLVLKPTGSELHLFPTQIIESQPRLLTGEARQKRLDYLAGISSPELADQIRQGKIMSIK